MVGEEYLPLPIGLRARAQADGQFSKRSTNIPGLSAEGEHSAAAHSVHSQVGGILDRWQRAWQAARTGPVA